MPDLKITIGADIKNLQSELAKAGGVTQDFANKTKVANDTIGKSFTMVAEKSRVAATSLGSFGAGGLTASKGIAAVNTSQIGRAHV